MDIPFFQEFLMVSNPITIGILILFVAMLGFVYYLQRRQTAFGNLVIIGTLLGAVLGFVVQFIAQFPDDPMKVVYIKESTKWFSLIGGGFIDLIRMLVIPLVFISIIHVILHMERGADLKKLVSSTAFVALVMVAIAAVVGLVLGSVTHLGEGIAAGGAPAKMREVKPVVDTLRALIPNNPISAMAETNVIAVVVFGVIIGGIARLIKQTGTDKLELVTKLFDELHLIISWVADFIIGLMPYGVLGLLATTLAQKGFQAIADMGRTMLNVSGSMTNAIVVDKLMGTFDQEAFNDTSTIDRPVSNKTGGDTEVA